MRPGAERGSVVMTRPVGSQSLDSMRSSPWTRFWGTQGCRSRSARLARGAPSAWCPSHPTPSPQTGTHRIPPCCAGTGRHVRVIASGRAWMLRHDTSRRLRPVRFVPYIVCGRGFGRTQGRERGRTAKAEPVLPGRSPDRRRYVVWRGWIGRPLSFPERRRSGRGVQERHMRPMATERLFGSCVRCATMGD